MTLRMNLGEDSYDITVARGALGRASELFSLDRRVLVLTDSGVPAAYAARVADAAREATVLTVPEGEGSKSLDTLGALLSKMTEMGLTRTDALVAVGGGVVGDLGGLAAATYMRGIDFYNVPTTLLSQVDSSIGGKTAINHAGVKNIVGAFHQPRGVLIDPDLLSTLPARQMASGMAEIIKMAATSDASLFKKLEKAPDPYAILEEIIPAALAIKQQVVEQDPTEKGLRRILNFGHTVGHGIEATANGALYHGECVALGMLPMCTPAVRARLVPLFEKVGLPTACRVDVDAVLLALAHDKKCKGGEIHYIFVPEIGSFTIEAAALPTYLAQVKEALSR